MSVQQNIDFIFNNRSAQLNRVTTSNGPLTFIGEWVAEWKVSGVAKKDYQRLRNKKFMGLQSSKKGSCIVPVSKESDRSETFQIMKYNHRSTRIRIKAPNGFFLQVSKEGHVTADSKGNGGWRDDDPSVFEMKIGRQFDGEFQVTNGYGKLAPKVMREHWTTFITEDDFKFMSSNGINTVRIPVGRWIAFDPTPPAPYVGGSLKALDNAFSWARKYGMKVIIDRVLKLTVQLALLEMAKHPSLYAVELLNEPCAPYVTLEKLKKYYRAGYNAVRKHSSTAYVIMASRMQYGMKPVDPTELFPLARELKGSAIDVHYYQIFMPVFKKMNHQQNIDFVYTNTSVELNRLIKPKNPQIFIGEWATEWGTANLAHPSLSKKTIEDYKNFGKAQLQVYGKATFGWAYWTLKCPFSNLSFEWMIKNGYLQL
ncbi:hypothetical protein TEA_023070 [Camellia sinensis var. sinensis]|uniref:Uncharacterized protein n=1 Tax=Camellia sinensis var. sinensis TaxID=542762 RepID=A0A4S4E6H2_CAMSN|nr:hypothetical protein TEA_023070 [Camellia sinensis var. sinensis]